MDIKQLYLTRVFQIFTSLILFLATSLLTAQESTIVIEHELSSTIEIPSITFEHCNAQVTFDYYKRNAIAYIEGKIKNDTCPVAQGSYELELTYLDDLDNPHSQVLSETWQQNSSSELSFSKEVDIGVLSFLRRVRARRVQCECLGKAGEETPE